MTENNMKYLDSNGLVRFLANIINTFVKKSDMDETISNITEGTTPVKEAEHAATADSAKTAATADEAEHAAEADHAKAADEATVAERDGENRVIAETYETIESADAREEELTALIDGKAPSSHSHAISEVTNLQSTLNAKAAQSSLDAHVDDADVHITSAERTKLSGIAAGAQVNTITGVKGGAESTYRTGQVNITAANIGLGNVTNTSDANKPVSTAQQAAINAAEAAAKEYAESAVNTAVASLGGTYYTEDEIDAKVAALNTAIGGKSDGGHTHNELYYTESEIDAKIGEINTAISGKADSDHGHAIDDVANLQSSLDAKVPTSRTINGKPLTANITLSAADVEADASGAAADALAQAQTYADKAAEAVKNELLNGAGDAYNTLKELADLIVANDSAIDALDKVATGKADKEHYHDDIYYRMSAVDEIITSVNASIATVQGGVDAVEQSVQEVDAKAQAAQTAIGELTEVVGTKVDTSDLATVITRISAAEADMATLESKVDAVDGRVGVNENLIGALQTSVSTKAEQSAFEAEINRAKAAEQANADAIAQFVEATEEDILGIFQSQNL